MASGRDVTTTRLLIFMILMTLPFLLMVLFASKQQRQPPPAARPRVVAPLPLDDVTNPKAALTEIALTLEREPKREDLDALKLKAAMICQYLLQPPRYEDAVRWYRRVYTEHKRSLFTPFARFQAAEILETKLRRPDRALKLYEHAWGGGRYGGVKLWRYLDGDIQPLPEPERVIIARLDNFYRKGLAYKTMLWVVKLCGGSKGYSYGLAMILLAVLAKLVLTPATTRYFEISRRMQLVTPEMKKLQERFRDDPKRMQKELFALYRQYKVNPMGGCLVMLVQAPILYGLYAAIRRFLFPLEDARFLWVGSLARPDLPLLVVYAVSMWATMKLMPTPSPDPQQQRTQNMMSLLTPVMFFFFFRSLPAAFILFWFVFNLASTAHQVVLMRKMQPAPAGGSVPSPARSRHKEAAK